MNKAAKAMPMIKMQAIRKSQKITQGDLAYKIGVRPMTIYYYEAGVRMPNAATLKKLARALNCSIDDIVEG